MWRAAEGRRGEWREVIVENGGKLLWRMEESVVKGELAEYPCRGPNSGGWGVRALEEERAKNWSPKYAMCRKHALQVPNPISLCPPTSQNVRYEFFKLGHFPGSVYAVAFAPRI